jgi:membrane-associated protein
VWIYAILFAVIFMETGFVVTPLLPGDSLLLTAGVLAAQLDPKSGAPVLNFAVLWLVCVVAAIAGDSTNYWIGRLAGAKLIKSGRFVKKEYVERTQAFFDRHGGKTVTIARFFVIVRTFAPFMAGVGGMHYPKFLAFSATGTLLWVTTFSGVGYLFGGVPFVRNNLEYGVMLILAASLIPGAWHWLGSRKEAAEAKRAASAE